MPNTRTLSLKNASNTVSLRQLLTYANDPLVGNVGPDLDVGAVWEFDGTSGPAVTHWWHGLVTLTAGAATLDLTALTDAMTALSVSMSTKKLKMLWAYATADNAGAITIAPGASNGYTGWTATGEVLSAGDYRGPNIYTGGIAVDGTHKTLDLSGTGTDSVYLVLLFG